WPRNWLPFRVGRSDFLLGAVLNRGERWVRFELYMRQRGLPPKEAYRQLEAQRDAIQSELGTTLDWQELPEKVASRIAVYLKNTDLTNREDWPRQRAWIREQLHVFRKVFTKRVKELELSAEAATESDDEQVL
ncbi:MAG: DUF4268 domain-containing protein, partial [Bosea sp. (in: a-proteobacteria)]